ncbi:MAG: CehA/McbA family metallohydrolase [Chloroflexaceae bacterium]|nr:CehA/McbA family metallohydrolase [Chloroflexaceae bacterium]
MKRSKPSIVPGVMHIHTTFSDGSGTIPEVVMAARQNGLRWIIVTDHDSLEGSALAGWHDDILLMVGHEITPMGNHFLALNVDRVIPAYKPPQDFIDEVYEHGGFGIIAHPDDDKEEPGSPHRWHNWEIDGPRQRTADTRVGLELWNFMSDWRQSHKGPLKRYAGYMFPGMLLRGPTADTLAWWDRLNQAGKSTFGIAGLDAHAFSRMMPWGPIKVFPYHWMFGTLTNYLLLDEPLTADANVATRQAMHALMHGRSYMVNRLYGDAPDVVFEVTDGDRQWLMGDSVPLNTRSMTEPMMIHADVGRNAAVRIIHNGNVLTRGVGQARHLVNEPGVYRLEASQGQHPWLYSNPIYVL